MKQAQFLQLLLDPGQVLRARGIAPDPWQQRLFLSTERQVLLNCSRQSGKSTAVAALALHRALFHAGSLILLLSPSLRQSGELFRKVMEAFTALGSTIAPTESNQTRLELANRSRVVCLPGREETIRGFSGVALLVIDEAARVPDDLYRSVRPMLAVSRGRLICLSTPFGKRGFFFSEWSDEAAPWQRVKVTWEQCPRICPDFIAEETRAMGESWVRQEYGCSFEAMEGLVYPDFADRCACDTWPAPEGKPVGGIDFGFRNPFCALWGVLDRDDVLWIGHERYVRDTPIHEHAAALPRGVVWSADPAGRTETEELRHAGLKVFPGNNDIQAGIAAVTARVRTGRLKVSRGGCPNLLHEAGLYRYPHTRDGTATSEVPIDDFNHALAALRYLVSRLDTGFMARFRKQPARPDAGLPGTDQAAPASAPPARPKFRLDQEHLWTPYNP
ncbi:MAG TPA: terminase family protein [Gemmataceae bacterium]|jgi:hypothetical protein|nr:terminase family protein [Gemmataceae bacterium]